MIEEFLGSTPLFARCEPSAVERIAPRVEAYEFAAGKTIVSAGAQAGWLGILFSGRATVRSVDAATGVPSVVETLRVGDHFGDVAALLGTGQPFAVVAEEDVTVLEIPGEVVDNLARSVAGFGTALARRLSTRLLQVSVQTVRRPSSSVGPPVAPTPVVDVARAMTPLPPSPAPGASVVPFVHVADYQPSPQVLAMVPARLVLRHQLLPLELRGNRLTVGMVQPRSPTALADLRRVLRTVEPQAVAIAEQDFAQATARFKIADAAAAGVRPLGDTRATPDALVLEPSAPEPFEVPDPPEDAVASTADAVLRRILLGALEREAKAIHFDPEAGGFKVRFRAEGTLADWGEFVPPSVAGSLVARVEELAALSVADRRVPRDGRFGLRLGHREIDLVLSTMPSRRGLEVVVRLFEGAAVTRPLEQLFLEPDSLAVTRETLERPGGAIVVAGPATSGRTSTLYAMMADLRRNRPGSSLRTIEDPVEMRLSGLTQAQADPARGLGVAAMLRATLRLDPDIVMVSEIRDPETTALVVEAATTGHLVLSSLHARDVFAALARLVDLGATRPLVAEGLALVLAQRLAPRLCAACVTLAAPSVVVAESLVARGLVDAGAPVGHLPVARGCDACRGTGHLGHVVVVEALSITDEVRAALAGAAPMAEVERVAREAKALLGFARAAKFLMGRQLIDASEALLVVAE